LENKSSKNIKNLIGLPIPIKGKTKWDNEAIEKLIKFVNETSFSVQEIAEALGKSINSIIQRASKEKLSLKGRRKNSGNNNKFILEKNPLKEIIKTVKETKKKIEEELLFKEEEIKSNSPNEIERIKAQNLATIFALHHKIEKKESKAKTEESFNGLLKIFSRFIESKAYQLASGFSDQFHIKNDLINEGRRTLYANLKRWHPNQDRRFSLGNIDKIIASSMRKLLNQSERIVSLPSKVVKDIFALNSASQKGETKEKEFLFRMKKEWTKNHKEAVLRYRAFPHPHANKKHIITEREDEHDPNSFLVGQEEENHDLLNHQSSFTRANPMNADIAEIINEAIAELSPTEEQAIRLSFGFGIEGEIGTNTLREIGKEGAVTGESIRQRINKAKKKLKTKLAKRGITSIDDALTCK
jgi:RNA polymerase sigma factor (sigma-70 family)